MIGNYLQKKTKHQAK